MTAFATATYTTFTSSGQGPGLNVYRLPFAEWAYPDRRSAIVLSVQAMPQHPVDKLAEFAIFKNPRMEGTGSLTLMLAPAIFLNQAHRCPARLQSVHIVKREQAMITNLLKSRTTAAIALIAAPMLLLTASLRSSPVHASLAGATLIPQPFDTCLLDNSAGNLFQFSSMTGQYRFAIASDGFSVTGTGVVNTRNGVRTLTDFRSDRRISAAFIVGQLTGSATIYLLEAAGVWQTFRTVATDPSNSCTCYPFASDYVEASCPQTNSPDFVLQRQDVDWRSKGAVTPVKNQGVLKADWAFSVTGAVEGGLSNSKGELTSLSEQELVDCGGTRTQECQGGSPVSGFIFAEQKGLCTEQSYPYTATLGTCQQCAAVGRPTGHVICSGEAALAAAVGQGPVSAVITSDWMPGFVGTGIVDAECSTFAPHSYSAVLVVGFTQDYWIVKNSLGTQWGNHGYFNLRRGKNACGINNFIAYPTFR
jgi:hypothetical protein